MNQYLPILSRCPLFADSEEHHLLLMLTCLQGLHPHSLISTFLPPILTAPFPLRLLPHSFLFARSFFLESSVYFHM